MSDSVEADVDRDAGTILHVKWGSGVEAYLRLSPDGCELATRTQDGAWDLKQIDGEAYLSDLRTVDPQTEQVSLDDSPWGDA